jgi:putative ABC transport system permease protein
MLKNYFLIAARNLLRNKVLSLINVSGLAIGLAVCMLIFLYTKDELSYDRFHEKKEELYQLTCRIITKSGEQTNYGLAGFPQGPEFHAEIPEIRSFVRVSEGQVAVKKAEAVFNEEVLWVDSNFFSVFSFPLLIGNPETVLSGPNSMVLTSEMALKYFGTEKAVGKVLEVDIDNQLQPFVVTGVARPSPENSSIKFKMLLPVSARLKNEFQGWFMLSFPTFFVMPAHTNLAVIEKKLEAVYQAKANVAEARKNGMEEQFVWGVQPFLDMHLNTRVVASPGSSDPLYSHILAGIAIFILVIACINFVNLMVAQSLHRSKEIGIRKVIGGERRQLVFQFLGESFAVCLVAFLLALLLMYLVLPLFNSLANKQLSLSYLADLSLLSGFLLLFVLTVLASGFYPALVLSRFDPVQTLYHKLRFTGKNYLSKGLIILQFALSTFLVISTLFIYHQFDYVTQKDLGYNEKNLLVITTGRDREKKMVQVFRNELSAIPGVLQVAPRMNGDWVTTSKANGHEIDVKYEHADGNYFNTIEVPLLEGRSFSADYPADSSSSVIINEAYARAAGWKGSPIGRRIDFLNGNSTRLTVVGLIRDYHFESLREKIKPQLFSAEPDLPFGRFLLRYKPGKQAAVLHAAEKVCRRLQPYRPFTYSFMEDDISRSYEAETRWKQIIAFSAIFAIFISCTGLFGLTMLSVQKRVKEIGIRKVLGAGVFRISLTVSENFLLLVLLAFLVAVPAAWYAVNIWLQSFAYHIGLSWYVFVFAMALISLLAIITISVQALKAAMANPVKNLRTE